MVGADSSSFRDTDQAQQQRQSQSWSRSSRAVNHGDQGVQDSRHNRSLGGAGRADADPVVSSTASPPLQSMQVATEWMEMEWKPFALRPGSTRADAEVVYSSRSISTTTGMRSIHPSPVFFDDNSTPLRMVGAKLRGDTSTAAGDRAAPSSPPTQRWREEIENCRMWVGGVGMVGGRGSAHGGGGGSSSTPVVAHSGGESASTPPAVSPRNRHRENSGNLLVPLLTNSRRTPRGQEVRERGEGLARRLQRDEDDSSRNTAAGTGPTKGEDCDGWECTGRRYPGGSPPPSPDAWTPATGKRPLFSGGEV